MILHGGKEKEERDVKKEKVVQDSDGRLPPEKGILKTQRSLQVNTLGKCLGAFSKVPLQTLIIEWNPFPKQHTIPSTSHYCYEAETIHLV